MKLIIAGASGFVAEEVIRQSIKRSDITSIIALARKPVSPPSDVAGEPSASKLRSVVVADYTAYPDDVRKEFHGADACIWTVAITPSKSRSYAFEEVVRVCQTSTAAGLQAMYDAGPGKPFRFLYMSGIAAERDASKEPKWMPEYSRLRGETENRVLAFAAAHPGDVEASCAKPGLITSSDRTVTSVLARAASAMGIVPCIDRGALATAMLDQVVNGFESDALMHDDLIRIAKAVEDRGK